MLDTTEKKDRLLVFVFSMKRKTILSIVKRLHKEQEDGAME